ncbi:hypothetical protein [Bifidobacterium choloepi]|uniref:Uncharacterized protein n=1 Tax=Bifidobacterium choloepi TaxID=2614131 RepID=A0A6I5N918_9BIFI|nr:hypothetical protein [Bifidobacterium choloepi]NEG70311.1 hypothetical protein [Bifidobacterium choloepi]
MTIRNDHARPPLGERDRRRNDGRHHDGRSLDGRRRDSRFDGRRHDCGFDGNRDPRLQSGGGLFADELGDNWPWDDGPMPDGVFVHIPDGPDPGPSGWSLVDRTADSPAVDRSTAAAADSFTSGIPRRPDERRRTVEVRRRPGNRQGTRDTARSPRGPASLATKLMSVLAALLTLLGTPASALASTTTLATSTSVPGLIVIAIAAVLMLASSLTMMVHAHRRPPVPPRNEDDG